MSITDGINLKLPRNKLDPKYFFFELPFYEHIVLDSEEMLEKAMYILNFPGNFDAYNFRLKENSTFEGYMNSNNIGYLSDKVKFIHVRLSCRRTSELYNYYIFATKDTIQKVGQYPSLADLNLGNVKEYTDVLSPEKLKEFIRGVGLRAHGVGIGSFVYLRRIFEYLIEEEHKRAIVKDNWNPILYKKSRMSEKIKLLKDYLPVFLVENKDLYNILSLGIHELSEDDCLKYFDALKMGIQEILDEKVIEEDRKKRRELAKQSLQNIRKTIKKM